MIHPLSFVAVDRGKGVGVDAKTKSMIPGSFACQVLNSAHDSCCVTARLTKSPVSFHPFKSVNDAITPQNNRLAIKNIDIAHLF